MVMPEGRQGRAGRIRGAGANEKAAGLQTIMQQVTGSPEWEFSGRELARVVVLEIAVESLSGKQSG